MQLTIIISYYKAINNLKLILKALNNQTTKEFEVIISEDDNNQQTIEYLHNHRKDYQFPIRHTHQKEDKGFRKNLMLNKSIRQAKTDRLVFIDGDCIPHKQFAREYIRSIDESHYFSGRAVMLGPTISEKILKTNSLQPLNMLSLLGSQSTKKKEGIYFPFFPLTTKAKGLVGRNWGIHKHLLLEINGFDNDYQGAGAGEDTDIEWRLKANGVKLQSVKNKAIVYHLYHPRVYKQEEVHKNERLLAQKIRAGHYRCLNGFHQVDVGY